MLKLGGTRTPNNFIGDGFRCSNAVSKFDFFVNHTDKAFVLFDLTIEILVYLQKFVKKEKRLNTMKLMGRFIMGLGQ